eukprot:m.5928 g.5928  ORF g.5928 m.5928 type:complete len:270 (+) comp14486_c0_seq1:138-947(+)
MVRVAVVTGANKGIGFAIVRSLCKLFDGDVVLTARDVDRGKEACKEGEGLRPLFHQLDITNSASISELTSFIEKTYGGLDVLVNNAGMAYKAASTAPEKEQAEVTIKANFTGTLNVNRALLPLMNPHGRVVNVASFTGKLSILKPQLQKKFSADSLTEEELVGLMEKFVQDVQKGTYKEEGWPVPFKAYGTSKVGVIAMTKIHARQISACGKEDILVNACCPGWVRTDMAGSKAPLSPDEGAETPVFCALLPSGGPTGEFFQKKAVSVW